MKTVQLGTDQKVKISLAPTTADGTAAEVQNATATATGDVAITPVDGETNAWWAAAGAEGVSTVEITGDADLGEGVNNITDTVELTVVAAEANNLGITVGTPEAK